MNAAQLAREVGLTYRHILRILGGGKLQVKKKKNRWELTEAEVDELLRASYEKVSALKKTYLRLYWEGLTIQRLQQKAEREFNEQGILLPAKGFVERAVYEDSLKG